MPLGSIIGGIMGQSGANAAGAASGAAGAQALSNSYDVGNRDVARTSPWQASGERAIDRPPVVQGVPSRVHPGGQHVMPVVDLCENRCKAAADRLQAGIVGGEPGRRWWWWLLELALLGLDRAMVHLEALPKRLAGWVVTRHQAAGAATLADESCACELPLGNVGGHRQRPVASARLADNPEATLRSL